MNELLSFLVGTCSLYWCAFSVAHVDDDAILHVRAYDRQADVIEEFVIEVDKLTLCSINIESLMERQPE